MSTNSLGQRNLSEWNRPTLDKPPRAPKRGLRDPLAVGLIIVAGFLIHFPGLLTSGFFSDESVYDYAAYAIGRGLTPYIQIMLPHPPLGYFALVPPVSLAQGNLLLLRTFNLCMFLVDAVISHWLFRILRERSSSSVHPLVGLAAFTLYPLPFTTTTPLEFTIFDLPILLATVFLVTGLEKKSVPRLAFSGVLLGTAIMIWFTAAFYAMSVIGFLAVYRLKTDGRRFLRLFAKQAAAFIIGGVVSVSVVLILIVAWGALPNFLLQSVGVQTSLRASFPLGERLHHIELAILQLLPLFIVAAVGGLEIVRRVKSGADPLILLPAWVLLANLVMVFSIPRVVLNHYVAYLLPFLMFVAAGTIEKLIQVILQSPRKPFVRIPWDYLQAALAILLVISAVIVFPYQTGILNNSPYTLANQTVGQYVASITLPGNAIWTSEGSIAYYAGRLIQAPNSTQWPFQAEYNDIFNTTYVDSDGITQRGLGVVSPYQFMSAWQSHGTKVLVFILGNGPIPYPDDFLWYGFPAATGVMNWTESNYYLNRTFTFSSVSYQYYIWLRR